MKTSKPIVVANLENELRKMDEDQLKEVMGFIRHCQQVSQINDPRREAMREIQQALTIGYPF